MNLASKLIAGMVNNKAVEVPMYRVDADNGVIHTRHVQRKKVTYEITRFENRFQLATFIKGRHFNTVPGTAEAIATWVPVPKEVIESLPEREKVQYKRIPGEMTPDGGIKRDEMVVHGSETARTKSQHPALVDEPSDNANSAAVTMDYAKTEEKVLAHVTTDPELLDEEGKPDPEKCAAKMMCGDPTRMVKMGSRQCGKTLAMKQLTGTNPVHVKPTTAYGRKHTRHEERKFMYQSPSHKRPRSVMATSEKKARDLIKVKEDWDRMPNGTKVWEAQA